MTISRTVFRCLLAGAAFATATGFSEPARAEVSVGINVNLGPPPIVVSAPPAVVMIPGSQVHFVPDPRIDVFFYGGYWWSPRGEQWYRSKEYEGPWKVIEHRRVPPSVVYMPRDYRTRYEREHHVPYGQWKKERSRYDRENRKAHKKWEKEREKEWKESREDHGKGGKHGDHGGYGGESHGKHGK